MDRISPIPYATVANTAHGEDHVTQPGHSEIANSTPLLLVYREKQEASSITLLASCFNLLCFYAVICLTWLGHSASFGARQEQESDHHTHT